jgi:hypothetical protein
MIKNRKQKYTSTVEELLISVPMFYNRQPFKKRQKRKSMLELNESTGWINLKCHCFREPFVLPA